MFFSPPGWSQERLAGYVAGAHAEIEDFFGPVSHLESPPRQQGRPADA
jgi:hypothetical protein